MNRKSIYSGSYQTTPQGEKRPGADAIERLNARKSEQERIRKLGQMLRESRADNKTLLRRLREAEAENTRLRQTLARRNR